MQFSENSMTDKNKTTDIIKLKVSALPDLPGVYQFFDKNGKIIYIGKAKNLKRRVASYFNKNHEYGKIRIMVRRIADMRHIVVDTEMDSLLLENNLIKKFQPRYNVNLKDDKSYPFICVKNERFPRVFYTRNRVEDGSTYYGPYTSVRLVKEILDLFRQLFKLRTCNYKLSEENITQKKFKVCLEYHIGNCLAPCEGKQDEKSYNENIENIHRILKGNTSTVIRLLKNLMQKKAENYEFEEAEMLKNKITHLENYQSKSMVVNPKIHDVDVYAYTDDKKIAFVNYFKIVNGAIIQTYTIEITKKLDESKQDLLAIAIADIRNQFKSTSKEIIVPFYPQMELEGIHFIMPQRGDKKKLLALAERNVKHYQKEKLRIYEKANPGKRITRILETMKNDLRLQEIPQHIECFDNSNMQGSFPVAACVVFQDAKPSKKQYRHYNIKTVKGIDDFASMKEVVYRRYKRLLNEDKKLPQLIVIDGGKGQLSAAVESLKQLNLYGKIAIIGIAKRLEEIYFPNDSVPIYLDKNSETLRVIQKIRNEAHRFGITFHRNKRSKGMFHSELENIDGVGEKTINKLLDVFKSVKKIKNAPLEELLKVINSKQAYNIYNYFHNSAKSKA